MKAGVSEHDHGAFRAAAWVAPADLTASTLLTVPPGDLVRCDVPWPEMVHDLVYRSVRTRAGAELDLRLDLLVPRGDGPFPLVVFVPGGGFVMSPKSGALLRRTAVAERGFVVASIEYRTLRTGVYADAVDDVGAAVAFLRRHANEFRIDADRVALWGESAGGYLSAMAVTTAAVTGARCVVDVFGLTDLSRVAVDFDADEQARHRTPLITEAQFVFGRDSGLTIDDDPDEVQRANPVRHVSGREPPFLLLHGEVDGLVSPGQSQLLHRALLDHGVDSTRLVVAGAGHYGIEWSSTTVLDRIATFLARHLAHHLPR
jgi:acetyl esterase/lipase